MYLYINRREYNRFDDTVYLVHGWTTSGAAMYDLRDEFLKNQVRYFQDLKQLFDPL